LNLDTTSSSKFQLILKGIHSLIETDGLSPGNRIPSERELSERLQAGRSSIREVLRALELLGLITTKRGEGTFLQPYNSHHLVDLLVRYIIRDLKTGYDLLEIRKLLEVGAVPLMIQRVAETGISELEKLAERMKELVRQGINPAEEVELFHALMVKMADNYLLTRIWYTVVQFAETVHSPLIVEKVLPHYFQIIRGLKNQELNQIKANLEMILQQLKPNLD
jgi:GntR family transcriptional repressor for pyruvate dehydrogenase complex